MAVYDFTDLYNYDQHGDLILAGQELAASLDTIFRSGVEDLVQVKPRNASNRPDNLLGNGRVPFDSAVYANDPSSDLPRIAGLANGPYDRWLTVGAHWCELYFAEDINVRTTIEFLYGDGISANNVGATGVGAGKALFCRIYNSNSNLRGLKVKNCHARGGAGHWTIANLVYNVWEDCSSTHTEDAKAGSPIQPSMYAFAAKATPRDVHVVRYTLQHCNAGFYSEGGWLLLDDCLYGEDVTGPALTLEKKGKAKIRGGTVRSFGVDANDPKPDAFAVVSGREACRLDIADLHTPVSSQLPARLVWIVDDIYDDGPHIDITGGTFGFDGPELIHSEDPAHDPGHISIADATIFATAAGAAWSNHTAASNRARKEHMSIDNVRCQGLPVKPPAPWRSKSVTAVDWLY